MCIDLCIAQCPDMCIGMCRGMCSDMCIGMCMYMCIDMCMVAKGIDMFSDVWIDMCIDMVNTSNEHVKSCADDGVFTCTLCWRRRWRRWWP